MQAGPDRTWWRALGRVALALLASTVVSCGEGTLNNPLGSRLALV